MQCVTQAVFNRALIFGVFHVDEIDHDQTTQVTQAELASDFVSGLLVGTQGGFFDIGAACGTGRVHIDRNQRFGVIDHHGAARGQIDGTRVGCFDLVLDLETREQRHIVTVTFDARDVIRHHNTHKCRRLIGNIVCIDQNLTDIW